MKDCFPFLLIILYLTKPRNSICEDALLSSLSRFRSQASNNSVYDNLTVVSTLAVYGEKSTLSNCFITPKQRNKKKNLLPLQINCPKIYAPVISVIQNLCIYWDQKAEYCLQICKYLGKKHMY